jgi:hypothetical protein
MILHSNFRDYYDGTLSMYRDPKIVYKRESVEYKQSECPAAVKPFRKYAYTVAESWGFEYFHVSLGAVIFCGTVYPFRREVFQVSNPPYHNSFELKYFYDDPYNSEDVDKLIGRSSRGILSAWGSDWMRERYYFDRNYKGGGFKDNLAKVYQTENKCPIIVVDYCNITLNGKLADVHFPLHVTEVAQALSGFLASNDPEILQTQDKYKIQAAGFDVVESFRREKGGPTRKRKKLTTSPN